MITMVTESNRWWHTKRPNIVFFISCDIKDATQYKSQNRSTWMFVVNELLGKIETETKLKFSTVDISCITWKRLGDEIIIAVYPQKEAAVIKAPKSAAA